MLPLSRTGSRSGRLPDSAVERCWGWSVLQLWAAWPLGCEYYALHKNSLMTLNRLELTFSRSVLAPTLLELVWDVEVPSAEVDLVVTAAEGMVEVLALPHATSAVVPTTSLVTVRHRL